MKINCDMVDCRHIKKNSVAPCGNGDAKRIGNCAMHTVIIRNKKCTDYQVWK